jgi:hypothetical protein
VKKPFWKGHITYDSSNMMLCKRPDYGHGKNIIGFQGMRVRGWMNRQNTED